MAMRSRYTRLYGVLKPNGSRSSHTWGRRGGWGEGWSQMGAGAATPGGGGECGGSAEAKWEQEQPHLGEERRAGRDGIRDSQARWKLLRGGSVYPPVHLPPVLHPSLHAPSTPFPHTYLATPV